MDNHVDDAEKVEAGVESISGSTRTNGSAENYGALLALTTVAKTFYSTHTHSRSGYLQYNFYL